MKRTSAIHTSRRRAAIIGVTAIAAVAALAPSAQATFKGKSGPIAFQRFTNPNEDIAQIFRLRPHSGRVHQLTSFTGGSFFPDYSPNGKRILFTSPFRDRGAIFTMRADGSHPVRLRTGCSGECLGDDDAAWSPDGRRIVFERAFGPIVNDNASALDLMVVRADGTRERVIRHFPLVGGGREPHGAQWSPDGRRLAVMLLNATKPGQPSAIYVLRPDGSHLRRITPLRFNAGNPDWAPDGKRIVFNSHFEGQSTAEIYTVRPDGSGLHRVRKQPEGQSAFEPVFSPGGRRIAFAGGAGVPHIWTMRWNGTGLRQWTHGSRADVHPDWGVRPQ